MVSRHNIGCSQDNRTDTACPLSSEPAPSQHQKDEPRAGSVCWLKWVAGQVTGLSGICANCLLGQEAICENSRSQLCLLQMFP